MIYDRVVLCCDVYLGKSRQRQSEDGVENVRAVLVLRVEGHPVATLGDKG